MQYGGRGWLDDVSALAEIASSEHRRFARCWHRLHYESRWQGQLFERSVDIRLLPHEAPILVVPVGPVFRDDFGQRLHVEDSIKGRHNPGLSPPLCPSPQGICPFTALAWAIGQPINYRPGQQATSFDVVFDDVWPRTTFGSDDPRAVPLYIRAGMDALWSNLYLAGAPASLPAIDRRLTVHEASGPEVAALEADWIGADRRPHLEYWASLPDVRIVVIRRGVAVVGTAIGRRRLSGRGRWMHHAVAAPGEDGPSILLAAMHAGLAGAEVGGGCIPSPSPLVRTLLEAGFRITDRDTYLASDPAIVDPYREIVNTGFL